MSKRRRSADSSRRNFLKGASLAGAAAAMVPPATAHAIPAAPETRKAAIPGPRQIAAETMAPAADPVNQTSSGGDFMVDVLNSLGIEYLAINCASSYRGLHEAAVNHANNKPEILTCVHEDIAVHIAQGYAKMAGRPMAMACHGVVGLQHATMAIYNAWCDRVPVIVLGGNIMEADKRAPGAEWVHSGVDIGQIVREFTKWDDQPASLQHFAESAVRAYKIATTPPMGPVFLALDAELQENPIPNAKSLRIPKFEPVTPPQADSGAIAVAAKMLVEAQNPIIICDRLARTPAGMASLVELAETLQCGVIDNAGRMNFPSRHPLNQSFRRGIIGQSDVILAIEMNDLWGTLTHFSDRIVRQSRPATKPDAKIITLGVRDLYLKSNYQDFGRWQDVDLDLAGDGEASLPVLTEAVRRLVDNSRKDAFAARGQKLAKLHQAMVDQSMTDATIGWDSSPITTARMCAEVHNQIKDQDWSLVGSAIRLTWPHRFWDFKKSYQWNGLSGGAGVGYNLPASIGAALANKKRGVFTVAFGGDGDFMFNPGALWTAAHHKIPILYIVHNNRAYHQEYMYLVAMAARHGRGVERMDIGTTLKDPNIDYATIARGMGVHGEGPITDPKDLGPALARAVAVVKSGEPAVVDVVTDPR
ncbi:MAG TPA: thiamine pyrophosphate-dependent enzyme [Xanthobacteraceae bacterium]|jgi:acetolactate synthase-1/2/3 large subunit|nr:thiamine pyrophosphate-dependent enzyme [Xanthobacteraceae bacterium]